MSISIYDKFSLPYLITKASRFLVKEYEKNMQEIGASPLQGGILFVISELEPVNQKDISNVLFIDKVTFSKMILSLHTKKFIKQKANPLDKRAKYWTITKKGLAVLEKVKAADTEVDVYLKKILKDTDVDTEQLSNSLRNIIVGGLKFSTGKK